MIVSTDTAEENTSGHSSAHSVVMTVLGLRTMTVGFPGIALLVQYLAAFGHDVPRS
jgi:hypothetical protein